MGLMWSVWQKVVWCGLIGGVIGLLLGALQGKQSAAIDLVFDTLFGTLLGLVLLGIPASIWVFGKWIFHGRKAAAPSQAGHAAMVGSTAAVPCAVIGGIGGMFLAGMILGCIGIISMFTGASWYNDIVNHWLFAWFGGFGAAGGLVGFLAGTFLGSAIGAVFGRIRSLSRE